MPLTKKQVAAYLLDPTKCPCCGSSMTDWDSTEPTEEWCNNCNAEWKQIFTLTDITLTREPKDGENGPGLAKLKGAER